MVGFSPVTTRGQSFAVTGHHDNPALGQWTLFYVPFCQFHHLHLRAGCWLTEQGQKRWDPESSIASSGSHPSSTCHILQDSQRWRHLLNKVRQELYRSHHNSAAKRHSSPSAESVTNVCICSCVIIKMLINKRVCNKRRGNQFQIVKQMAELSYCCMHTHTHTHSFRGRILSPHISTNTSIVYLLSFIHVKT